MASLRERFTVSWDDGEPVEVLTTVYDLMLAVDMVNAAGRASNRVAIETTMLHCALERNGIKVPPYDEWMLLLDAYEKVSTVVQIEDPTEAGPLATVPYSSAS